MIQAGVAASHRVRLSWFAGMVEALRRPGVQAAVLLAATVLIRVWRWTNPAVMVDEQFYLLVGDRMLHGALPYVDIWDRKPVGLFLIFAGIRLLGGSGIVQYHVVAALFAAATAIVIARIATRITRPLGAVLAGIAYLIWLDVFGGEGAQSPVFYNLLVAGAGLLTLRAVGDRTASSRTLLVRGVVAMLLCGLAIQVKYTALFEGAYFGLVLVGRAWTTAPRWRPRAAEALLWIACGVAPTLAAWAAYAAIGQNDAFVFANFTSIFHRVPSPALESLDRLWLIVRDAFPLLVGTAVALAPFRLVDRLQGDGLARRFVAGWAAMAVVGLLLFGTYYDHYFLPVLVPISIGCAPLLADLSISLDLAAHGRRLRVPLGLAILVFGAITAHDVIHKNLLARGKAKHMRSLVAAIQPHLTNCMYVYDGEPILYYLTGSCLPTRYPFPDHLNNKTEIGAIGVDNDAEVRRIMAGKPNIVVTTEKPVRKTNMDTWAIMQDALARDYHAIFTIGIGRDLRMVYERDPGH